ncbi:DUF1993 family protein [Anderseniella sp. Alg231-50]|uniref:DUF1993 family protein n=1 Tax=Anderseniella sp. Alg231-50 TaxID=1922226 RepID=UPI000D55195B
MSLHTLVVPGYAQMLRGLSAQLEKGAAWAIAADVSEADFLAARLAPDMNPLSDQVRFICIQAREVIRRLTDRHVPEPEDEAVSLDQLKSLIADTLALLDEVSEADFEGAEDRQIEIVLADGMTFDLTGFQYVRDWALAQFYFHAVTAYAIMRHQGVELGKADYVNHMFAYLRRPEAGIAE